MTRVRPANCHYCPTWVTALWLVVGMMALLYVGGCRRGVTTIDLGPRLPLARGTITGLVHGPTAAALAGRTVEAVNLSTGETLTATTAENGGFTIELPKGKYRVQLQLHDTEMLAQRPGIVDLDRADGGSNVEFVVAAARPARRPSYRLDNGLGSPIV